MKSFFNLSCLVLFIATTACSTSKSSPEQAVNDKEKKITVETGDVEVSESQLRVPIRGKCIKGFATVVLQIGDFYKAFECKNGGFNYTHQFPTSALKENREKRRDYVLRVRAFHEEKKNETLAQSLVVISYKDFQSKLVINETLVTVDKQEGVFTDLFVYGQCAQESNIEIEIFDDWRGVSLEEDKQKCSETGFAYASRRPGYMKKGMRLLLREMKNDKPLSSYEVVLYN